MKQQDEQIVDGLKFVMTCSEFPEQYDVFDGDNQVGYVRMRYGNFSVSCPDAGDCLVVNRGMLGYGAFEDDERELCLKEAASAIRKWMNDRH